MDIPPPKLLGDDRTILLALWRYQRESFARTVDGVSDEDARRRFVPSATTLLWLTQHLANAEQIWILERFAGRPPLEPAPHVDEPITDALARLRRVWAGIDTVVASADFDDRFTHPDGTVLTLRWVVAHLLEEVARHAGHADILRELVDGSTGR